MESLCSSGHQEPRKAERMTSSSSLYLYRGCPSKRMMSLSTKRSTSSSAHRIITAGVAQLTSQYCGYYSKVIQSRKDYRQLDGAQMWGYLTQEAMNRTEHVELLHPPHYTSVSTLMPTWESMLHNLPSNCVCHYIELMMFTRHLHHYQ